MICLVAEKTTNRLRSVFTDNSHLNQWVILAGLLLGIILILLITTILFFWASRPGSKAMIPTSFFSPTLTRTATLVPTNTITPTSTNSPTASPRPTSTNTNTATPSTTPLPTLTPARIDTTSNYYYLANWSPEIANRAIQLLVEQPNTLSVVQRGINDQYYYDAFYIPALAQGEALLLFPDVPDLPWRLGRANNLVLSGEPSASTEFGVLFASLLNQQVVSLPELPEWLNRQIPDFQLNIVDLPARQNGDLQYLLELYGPGGLYILLVENGTHYEAYPLVNEMDVQSPRATQPIIGDLTGDGIDEIVIWKSSLDNSNTFEHPRVFNVATLPPSELTFAPGDTFFIGTDNSMQWFIGRTGENAGKLIFQSDAFPPCPANISRKYGWDGTRFNPTDISYSLVPPNDQILLSYCQILIDHAANFWGPEAAIPLIETLLPYWPPQTYADGSIPPLDAVDELRYRLGVYYILAGDPETGLPYLANVSTNPVVPLSRWIDPARQFLNTYKSPLDLYRACVPAPLCDPRLAFEQTVLELPKSSFEKPVDALQSLGVIIRSSAPYDFDADNQNERWFTIRHKPDQMVEYWILATSDEQIHALFVDTVSANITPLSSFGMDFGPPVVWLGNQRAFRLFRDPVGYVPILEFEPLLYFYDAKTRETSQKAADMLFYGGDPADIFDMLRNLETIDQLSCITDITICQRYYQIRGIAAQMMGDQAEAAFSFYMAWELSPANPYTTYSRLRLVRDPNAPTLTPTPSRTPTITSTPTITRTPTITLNPSITRIPTKTATVTNTRDPSHTDTPTPTPSPTNTRTPTLTLDP
jgi:hypothetical protein